MKNQTTQTDSPEFIEPVSLDDSKKIETPEDKIEKEKNELLNRLVANNIIYLKDRVAFILNNSIEARNSDIDLAWIYWQTYQSDRFNGDYVTRDEMINLTRLSSISRERARIQNQYKLFQADPEVKKFRFVREGNFKQAAIEDRPEGEGFFHVYIDETGKTQDYLSIGSLWIIKHSGYNDILKSAEIAKWKKDVGMASEFHFNKIHKATAQFYKTFFEMFLSKFPEVGFKLIVVSNKGISNQSSAIVDMTFHLLHKGVIHENETGRAKLPRRLQVSIDEEEKGSDKLKIENIKERISAQNVDGLRLGLFETINSSVNDFIQIVDLFTASVNRKLHNPEGKSVKDEVADHILSLVGLNIDDIDKENADTDHSYVFNLLQK